MFAPVAWSAESVSPAGIEERLRQGTKLYNDGALAEALKEFEAILVRHPGHPEALYYAGVIYIQLKNIDKGLALIKRSAELAPSNPRVLMALAQAYDQAQQFEQAITQYRRVLAIAEGGSRQSIEAEKNLNLALIRRMIEIGDFGAALELASIVRSEYANDTRVLHVVGLIFLNMGRLAEAEETFKRRVTLTPGSAEPHFYLAEVYEKAGKPQQAIEQLKRGLELEPNGNFTKRINVKMALLQATQTEIRGDRAGALREYRKVLAIDPKHPTALLRAGVVAHELNLLDDSMQFFKDLLAAHPSHLGARLNLGALYIERNQLVDGVKELDAVVAAAGDSPLGKSATAILQAEEQRLGKNFIAARNMAREEERLLQQIAANPDLYEARFALGLLYVQRRKLNEALEQFTHAIRIRPQEAKAHSSLAVLHDELAQYDAAINEYGLAIALQSDPVEAQRLAGYLQTVTAKKLYAAEDFDQAIQQFRYILDQDPENVEALFFSGLIYTRRGEMTEAQRMYERVIALNPDSLGARLNLGLMLEQTGQEEEALRQYRYIVDKGLGGPIQTNAEGRIPIMEQILGGFSYYLGYNLNIDSNANLRDSNPEAEYTSALYANLAYRHRIKPGLAVGLGVSPSYSIAHIGQTDYFQNDIGPYVVMGPNNQPITAGYTYREISGVLNEEVVSSTQSAYVEILRRFERPAFIKALARAAERENTNTALSARVNYQIYEGESSQAFNSKAWGVHLSASQSLGGGYAGEAHYSIADSTNTAQAGNDYAYQSHELGMRADKFFSPKLSGYASLNYTLYLYKNDDSIRLASSGQFEKRVNHQWALASGINYRLHDDFSLRLNLAHQLNESSLPTSGILTIAERVELQIQQSRSVGSFQKTTLALGFTLTF